MSIRWLYRVWRRLPSPLQQAYLWSTGARFIVGVSGLITDDEGRVLLLRHDYRRTGRWGLPGGWLKGNEGPAGGLRRELREETGLEIEVGPIVAAYRSRGLRRLNLVYRCRVRGGQLILGSEIGAAHYFGLHELPADLCPEQVEFVQRLSRVTAADS